MSYDEQKAKAGREPVQILEVYAQRCALDYGTAPCAAAIGVTGDAKCFNVLGSGRGNGTTDGGCQDEANFDADESVPYVFATRAIHDYNMSKHGPVFPLLVSAQTSPTKLTPGKGLGIRASVSVTLQDTAYTDAGIDPYVDERDGGPLGVYDRGTLLGRLLRRHRFIEGRRADLLTGYLDDNGQYNPENFVRRTYVVERAAYPDASGKVSLTLKDPLKKANPERAQFPAPQSLTLLDPMPVSSPGQLQQINTQGDLTGLAPGDFIRIEDEVMEIILVGVNTLDVLRATWPAIYPEQEEAPPHDADTQFQPCGRLTGRIDAIIYELLTNVTGIDPQFFPQPFGTNAPQEWEDVADVWMPDYLLDTLIVEPTGVKDLITELTELGALVWWDERRQVIRFDALKPLENNLPPTWDDDTHLIADSVQSTLDPKGRVSRVWVHHGQRDPREDLDDQQNYRQIGIDADLDAERVEEYGEVRVRRVFSRWLNSGQVAIANEVGVRLLLEYRDTKVLIAAKVDAKDDGVWTGDTAFIATRYLQDEFGNPAPVKCLLTEVKEVFNAGKVQYVYGMQEYPRAFTEGTCMVWTEDSEPPYPGDGPYFGFWGDDDNKMPNGDAGFIWC